jgi:hypothetical protein
VLSSPQESHEQEDPQEPEQEPDPEQPQEDSPPTNSFIKFKYSLALAVLPQALSI